MSQRIFNLHNHTPFSDGAYTIDEICDAHLKLDFKVEGVGISDHLFCTPSSREIRNEREFERLFAAETRKYVAAVHEARRTWAGKLAIFCGVEINWPLNKSMLDLIRSMLGGVDYVLFEYVDWAGLTQLANQARRWPCPVGLAHTDVAVQYPNTSIDQVVRTIANARIFYEVNTKLLPLANHDRWFGVLPQHRVLLSVGSDTHDDLSCLKTLQPMFEYVARKGLNDRLLMPQVREEAATAVAG